ncbi:MAG: DUF5662 family protein [Rickettsiales bacterium]|jgi:hypothetical protein|nr:DUF5662 family protein [Rickettsiales bacterium]
MQPSQKQIDYFNARTKAHIETVIFFGKFLDRDFTGHDESKLTEPELTPYIWLTEEKAGRAILTLEQKEQVRAAVAHHYAANPHHPEFYKNIADMPMTALAEAVCDWAAMQYEIHALGFQTKYPSLSDFYYKCALPKYGFTDIQRQTVIYHSMNDIGHINKTGINSPYRQLEKIWLPVQKLK